MERLRVAVKRMLNDVPNRKRNGKATHWQRHTGEQYVKRSAKNQPVLKQIVVGYQKMINRKMEQNNKQ